MITHEENWIALAEILGPRSPMLKPLLARFESPENVFAATEAQLREAFPDMNDVILASLLRQRTAKEAARLFT